MRERIFHTLTKISFVSIHSSISLSCLPNERTNAYTLSNTHAGIQLLNTLNKTSKFSYI